MREASATNPTGNRQRLPGQKVTVGETLAETQARRRASLDGMNAGAFLLMPGGVSRAAACDGNWYSVGYNYGTLAGTLPIN